jgi:hypothetical protein
MHYIKLLQTIDIIQQEAQMESFDARFLEPEFDLTDVDLDIDIDALLRENQDND